MHSCDREQVWMQIDRISESIHELRVRVDNPACRCCELECDVCANVRADERDFEELHRQRKELLNQFPEVRYDGQGDSIEDGESGRAGRRLGA